MQAVLADLDDIVETNRQDGDKVKGAAVLTAYPGLGKTTLAVAYGAGFHRRQVQLYGATTPAGDQRIPVAYIGLTSNTRNPAERRMALRLSQQRAARLDPQATEPQGVDGLATVRALFGDNSPPEPETDIEAAEGGDDDGEDDLAAAPHDENLSDDDFYADAFGTLP